jgi:hypothetical protein
MYALKCDSCKLPKRDQREFVLADLVSLRYVRIKIIFAVPLGKVRKCTADSNADFEYVLDRAGIRHRESARMTETNRADVSVGPPLVRIVAARAEHLGVCLEFGVNLQSDRRDI